LKRIYKKTGRGGRGYYELRKVCPRPPAGRYADVRAACRRTSDVQVDGRRVSGRAACERTGGMRADGQHASGRAACQAGSEARLGLSGLRKGIGREGNGEENGKDGLKECELEER